MFPSDSFFFCNILGRVCTLEFIVSTSRPLLPESQFSFLCFCTSNAVPPRPLQSSDEVFVFLFVPRAGFFATQIQSLVIVFSLWF